MRHALEAAGTLLLLALGAYLMAGAGLEAAGARATPESVPGASFDSSAAKPAAPAAVENPAVAGGNAERCGAVHQAKGEKPIIDDFNRVDLVIDGYDERIGKWYTYHDESALPPGTRSTPSAARRRTPTASRAQAPKVAAAGPSTALP